MGPGSQNVDEPLSWQTLRDRVRIADALSLFCERVDAGDLASALQVFHEDCVTNYGPSRLGPLQGRQAFLDRARSSQARFSHTHHQLGQVRITIQGDTASTVAYVTAAHQLAADGSRYDERLQYHDEWVCAEGRWLIRTREVFFALIDGAMDGEADHRWVPRRPVPD